MSLFKREHEVDTAARNVHEQAFAWLDERFNGVYVNEQNGWIMIPGVGSTTVGVAVASIFDGQHIKVEVFAPLLFDVGVTDDLLRYLGREGQAFHFGHLRLEETDGKTTGALLFEYPLLGDQLDRVELETACVLVGSTADNLDNDLQTRFGGTLFSDMR